MDNILQMVRQEAVEHKYNRKHIDVNIRYAIDNTPETQAMVDHGVNLLHEWLEQDHHESKKVRISQLELLDMRKLVNDIFTGVAYFQLPELFSSAVAQLTARLGFDDKRAALLTMSEVLSVLAATDAYDITKENKMASLMIKSKIYLPEEVVVHAMNSQYLPPMVCEPLELKSNYDSGYLTHKDSVILGKGNHHDGNVCLDVLNTMNRVALKLDVDFLKSFEEEPSFELDNAEKRDMWLQYKKTSTNMQVLMVKLGNEFYLTHKVDKRGRIYAQGYHISTMGNPFCKAMIELANEELVEGVPST
jgi:hypothetical protein